MGTSPRFLTLFLATGLVGSVAQAADPPDPYDVIEQVIQAPPAPPAEVAVSPPVVVQPPAIVIQPPPVVVQPPPAEAAPPMAQPPPPTYYQVPPLPRHHRRGPGYYYPPAGYAAPIYAYPPPIWVHPRRPVAYRPPVAPAVARPKARFFSFGFRLATLGINQEINGKNVVLGGGGFQLRFRTRGRFGMEGAFDVLTARFPAPGPGGVRPGEGPAFHVGAVERTSMPTTLSALLYVFPNDDARIFNLYFLAGIGAQTTTMKLPDEFGVQTKQKFTELLAQTGLGLELRFRWFALQADGRLLGLVRDDSELPAGYYAHVDGAPVPKSSWGGQGTVGAAFWF